MVSKKKAFITGIAGFAGSYLAEYLLERGYSVFGLVAPGERTDNIKSIINDIDLVRFDILKRDRLAAYLKRLEADYIYHLAAVTSVGESFGRERDTYRINFTGSLNLFEAASGQSRRPAGILFVSSSDVYGIFRPQRTVLDEDHRLNPVSPYAVSKAAGEYLARYHGRQGGLPIIIVRPFNHTGPRQTDKFVVPSFCRKIATIEAGQQKPDMGVGNLTARRDLSDVRDIVAGYYLALTAGRPGEVYNLCTGTAVSIRNVLDKLRRFSEVRIRVVANKKLYRKLDVPILRGDNTRAKRELGWSPTYKLSETLLETLEYWRQKVHKSV